MICCSFWGSKGRDDLTPTFVQVKHGTIWIAFVQGQDITKPEFEQSGINALKQNMLPPSPSPSPSAIPEIFSSLVV